MKKQSRPEKSDWVNYIWRYGVHFRCYVEWKYNYRRNNTLKTTIKRIIIISSVCQASGVVSFHSLVKNFKHGQMAQESLARVKLKIFDLVLKSYQSVCWFYHQLKQLQKFKPWKTFSVAKLQKKSMMPIYLSSKWLYCIISSGLDYSKCYNY